MVPALIQSIQYDGEQGKVAFIEELCLQDNGITVKSLKMLAPVLQLLSFDLRDLDLSNNAIKVKSTEDVRMWEEFLASLASCCVLRRLDLSGNALGPKAFEILAKAFAREEYPDAAVLKGPGCINHQHEDGRVSPRPAVENTIAAKVRRMSVKSEPDDEDEDPNEGYQSQLTLKHKGSRHGRPSQAHFGYLFDPVLTYSRAKANRKI